MTQIYENIKELRLLRGMTQTQLADKLGYADKSMIAKIEKGQVDLPHSKILAFAKVLAVEPGELMGWDSEPSSSSEADQADRLFIEKYSRDVFDVAMKYSKLDSTDKVRATERIDTLLEDDKYRLGGEYEGKAI